jgi:hypothetical protein
MTTWYHSTTVFVSYARHGRWLVSPSWVSSHARIDVPALVRLWPTLTYQITSHCTSAQPLGRNNQNGKAFGHRKVSVAHGGPLGIRSGLLKLPGAHLPLSSARLAALVHSVSAASSRDSKTPSLSCARPGFVTPQLSKPHSIGVTRSRPPDLPTRNLAHHRCPVPTSPPSVPPTEVGSGSPVTRHRLLHPPHQGSKLPPTTFHDSTPTQ